MNKTFFFLLLLVVACTNLSEKQEESGQYIAFDGFTQGTFYHVKYYDESERNFQPQIDSLLKSFDSSLNTYIPNSIISRINQNDVSVVTDSKFDTIFYAAKKVWKQTDGAFDITIAPIADVWGFGSGKKTDSVKQHTIDSLLMFVGMDKIELSDSKVSKSAAGVQLNVNAIAQGYAVDVVAQFLEQQQIENYMVEIGGELTAKGVNDKGEKWAIGIDKPEEENDAFHKREIINIINIDDKSVATSGNYRQYVEKNGTKYAHTLDPRTGRPKLTDLLSVTIVGNSCMYADAYATACMVMGYDKGKELISKLKGFEGYFIYADSTGRMQIDYTDGFNP